MSDIQIELAKELGLRLEQVQATLALHEEGATVPFIARYRKEATGGLDEVQIQAVLDGFERKKEVEDRRAAILRSIEEQGKLTPELKAKLEKATTRTELEDLYLPYRPKRRTRAAVARERGLEPLADLLWKQAAGELTALAKGFIDPSKEVPDLEAALAGARDICAERVAEDASLRAAARTSSTAKGRLASKVVPKKREEKTKFDAWYDFSEPLTAAPSHRVLAMLRGEAEEVLKVGLELPDDEIKQTLRGRVVGRGNSPAAKELAAAVDDGWERLMSPSLESELMKELKARADAEAVEIFAKNLRHLLLAPPAAGKKVLALDPGLRTGIKLAMLDETGRVLQTATLYSEAGPGKRAEAAKLLSAIATKYAPDLIAVGNGTGSREAELFVKEALGAKKVPIVQVSEQGASVYSASAVAREEFPDLDVSLRGAISIGRRLQDPLAELVKIDPRSIGVGQYQHDVDEGLLRKKLGEVIDSCVNAVGVDVNTASPQLLEHVSGIGPTLAQRIVSHREENGPFASRAALRKVKGMGPKAFEQAAGFLRVRGKHPLDDSAVHPERYAVVERMAKELGVELKALVGKSELVRRIDWRRYVAEDLGEPTLKDILAELEKPGRDPRGDFSPPSFREELQTLDDVKEGMVLQGVVTNVTAFGAFVDVGVHQDGLVHVSQLAAKYVKDPAEVVKVGDKLTVKVISVDLERKRLGLSVKAMLAGGGDSASSGPGSSGPASSGPAARSGPASGGAAKGAQAKGRSEPSAPFNNPFSKLK